jgi:hypothetical protein
VPKIEPGGLRSLLLLLIDHGGLMKLGGERFARPPAEGLFDELAGIAAGRSGESLRDDGDLNDMGPWYLLG